MGTSEIKGLFASIWPHVAADTKQPGKNVTGYVDIEGHRNRLTYMNTCSLTPTLGFKGMTTSWVKLFKRKKYVAM